MYSLPTNLPIISFHTEASRTPKAISTMSHIAHAELPWLPRTTRGEDSSQGTPKLHVTILYMLPWSFVLCTQNSSMGK